MKVNRGNKRLSDELEILQQYTRPNNLRVLGIADDNQLQKENNNFKFDLDDIDGSHWMGASNNKRHVIVKLFSEIFVLIFIYYIFSTIFISVLDS